MKTLLVDDDPDHLDLLGYRLRRDGHTVVSAIDGLQAIQRWEKERPDIILLDVTLPKLGGVEVCRRLRHDYDCHTPIILLTAKDEDDDVLQGLRAGADDYVSKPFSPKVLIARMQAVLRRTSRGDVQHVPGNLKIGDLVLDPQAYAVTRSDRAVGLTRLEFRILYILAMNPNRIIPYSRLVEYVWGYDGGDANLLKTHICHIRQKLELSTAQGMEIKAMPGVGYGLSANQVREPAPPLPQAAVH